MSEARPELEGFDGRGRRIAIVVGRFNAEITDSLTQAAKAHLLDAGVADGDIRVVPVAGAFELPLLAHKILAKGDTDGVIALGAVIRGGTPHFDYVCEAAMQGCLRVSLDTGKPVAFGVLTCDTLAQAQERSGSGPENKGIEAAAALLESLHRIDNL